MKNWYKFYLYSVGLGLRYLISNPLKYSKEAIKRIIIPMDIGRYFEIPSVFNHLGPKKGESILDLSSPKLISFYIAEKTSAKVMAVDLLKEEVVAWRQIKEGISRNKKNLKTLKFGIEDGRRLSYKSQSFDKVFCISVIEHVDSDGDSKCIRELARVLKPGGLLILTTPFVKHYRENITEKSVFVSRFYDPVSLSKRLIKPSGLTFEKKIIYSEKYPRVTNMYSRLLPLSALFGLVFPLFSLATLSETKVPKEKSVVLLVLRKKAR